MRLDRRLREELHRGDLGVRQALGGAEQDLALTRGQPVEVGTRRGRRALAEPFEHGPGRTRGDDLRALGHGPDRGEQQARGGCP